MKTKQELLKEIAALNAQLETAPDDNFKHMEVFMDKYKGKKICLDDWPSDEWGIPTDSWSENAVSGTDEMGTPYVFGLKHDWKLWKEPVKKKVPLSQEEWLKVHMVFYDNTWRIVLKIKEDVMFFTGYRCADTTKLMNYKAVDAMGNDMPLWKYEEEQK